MIFKLEDVRLPKTVQLPITADTIIPGEKPSNAAAKIIEADKSFADEPMSLTEARTKRGGFGDQWTSRDALIHMLRRIDSGEIAPAALVVVWCDPKTDTVTYCQATQGLTELVGMLEIAKHSAVAGGEVS